MSISEGVRQPPCSTLVSSMTSSIYGRLKLTAPRIEYISIEHSPFLRFARFSFYKKLAHTSHGAGSTSLICIYPSFFRSKCDCGVATYSVEIKQI